LEQPESPEWLNSGGSLRSSLTSFAVVLTSPAFVQPLAPFSPTRRCLTNRLRAGLKGARAETLGAFWLC